MDETKDVADRIEIDANELLDAPMTSENTKATDDFSGSFSNKAQWFRKLTVMQHLSGMLTGGLVVSPLLFALVGVSSPMIVAEPASRALELLQQAWKGPASTILTVAVCAHVGSGVAKTSIRRQGKNDDDEIQRLTPRTWERWTGYGLLFGGMAYYYRRSLFEASWMQPITTRLPNSIIQSFAPMTLTFLTGLMAYHQFTAPQYFLPTIKSFIPSLNVKLSPQVVKVAIVLSVSAALTGLFRPVSPLQASAYRDLSRLLTNP
jgi:hypothetical protein